MLFNDFFSMKSYALYDGSVLSDSGFHYLSSNNEIKHLSSYHLYDLHYFINMRCSKKFYNKVRLMLVNFSDCINASLDSIFSSLCIDSICLIGSGIYHYLRNNFVRYPGLEFGEFGDYCFKYVRDGITVYFKYVLTFEFCDFFVGEFGNGLDIIWRDSVYNMSYRCHLPSYAICYSSSNNFKWYKCLHDEVGSLVIK